MHIKSIELENFRCFEHLTVDFPEDYAVLIGINGAGKSSILDAVAIALGAYLSGSGIPTINIHKTDARILTYAYESGVVREETQYPIRIATEADIGEPSHIKWTRALNSSNGRTTSVESHEIMDYANALRQKVKKNDPVKIPLFAYYGTGRLWLPKKAKQKKTMSVVPSRLHGYVDALDAATNEKLMLEWFKQSALIEVENGTPLPIFQAVKQSMEQFYVGMDADLEMVRVSYSFTTWEIKIRLKHKNAEVVSLPLSYFSDGIKSMLSMTADIAYRMALLNPNLGENAIAETSGIVLIDEIDMHLHPSWQSRIMSALRNVFPRIQFIVTTHAPAVLANVPRENIIAFSDGKAYPPAAHTYGRDVTSILREVMEAKVRPQDVMEKKKRFYEFLDDEDFVSAEKVLDAMESIVGECDETVRMRVALDMEKM